MWLERRRSEINIIIQQLRTIALRQHDPNAALRVVVESGGCHGYQYKLELATARLPED